MKLTIVLLTLLIGCVVAPKEITTLAQYKKAIHFHIAKRLIVPRGKYESFDCTIRATQDESGIVSDIRVGNCEDPEELKDLFVKTIAASSPLPIPTDKSLFDSEFQFRFCKNCEIDK